MLKNIYTHIMHDSLYRNSIYLMASTLITACLGFIFWIINARLVPPEQIGIATAMISAGALITQFSLLGLKDGIIRYLPTSAIKNTTISTGLQILTLFTVILCTVFIIFLPVIAPKLMFLRDSIPYLLVFILFVTSFSLNQFQEGIFVAYRSAGYVLIKNALWGTVKVLTPFFAYRYGADGVFFAFSAGSVVSFLFGLYTLISKYHYSFSFGIVVHVIRKIGKFSLGNYVGGFLTAVPPLVLPLIIIHHIGPEASAYYYIDLQIAGLLYVIPVAATQSLFAESSHNEEDIKKHLKKTLLLICLLMIPAIVVISTLGIYVLRVFGDLYAQNGLSFLRLLAISGIFVSINCVGSAVMNIKRKVHIYMLLSFISAVLVILLSFIFLPYHLTGIGFAWLIGEGVVSILYLIILSRILR